MNFFSTRLIAVAGACLLLANVNAVSAGSVSMDGGAEKTADIRAYVDTYGAAVSGNATALENLRTLGRLYDAQTLVQAADIAFEKHGILIYPSQTPRVADAQTIGDENRQGG